MKEATRSANTNGEAIEVKRAKNAKESSQSQAKSLKPSRRKIFKSYSIYICPFLFSIFLWYFLNSNLFNRYKQSISPLSYLSDDVNEQIEFLNENFYTNDQKINLNDDQANVNYRKYFTNKELKYKSQIEHIESMIETQRFKKAAQLLGELAKKLPNSARLIYLSALTIEHIANSERNDNKLKQSIDMYKRLFKLDDIDINIFYLAGKRLVKLLNFAGRMNEAIRTNELLLRKIPNNINLINELGVNYLTVNKFKMARDKFLKVLNDLRPNDTTSICHYAFILKLYDNNLTEAVVYFKKCLSTLDKSVMDARFFYHLGDSLQRLNKTEEAYYYYKVAADNGLFLSMYQRSLYNEKNLRAQPWWTKEETTYEKYFQLLESNWQMIRDEALALLNEKTQSFSPEDENLRAKGNWKQFNLFVRGKKLESNCKKASFTCRLIDEIEPASSCTRGQVKFSVISGMANEEDMHIWPHCGPSNSRLRAHLGLKIPGQSFIRVANETREWIEGKFLIFDDSFEHEVWHKGFETRLVLIVDFWHPDLNKSLRKQLNPI